MFATKLKLDGFMKLRFKKYIKEPIATIHDKVKDI